ncbi:MAG: hypothetical protein ABJN34_05280 [Litoreibacter sp.]|uniref:hypothetical protein n=1 Tax=Litoreibacter sp. TaxID=1969459 RepID=UPI003299E2CF
MIWPLRRKSPSPEAPLWSFLDACGIPFRAPIKDWVDQMHLTHSGWSDGLDYCIPPTQTPLIDGLDFPIRAQVSEYTDYDAPPDYLWGALQGVNDLRLNYAKGIAQLSALFGKGIETSSTNTISREWRFGLARVTCSVSPPDKQRLGSNTRHQMFPETEQEALVAIHPAWRTPLGKSEHSACATAIQVWSTPNPTDTPLLTARSRDWPIAVTTLQQGLALSSNDALLQVKPAGVVDIYPCDAITGLKLERITAGRGGAGSYLTVETTSKTREGPRKRSQEIASSLSTAGLDEISENLAQRLDAPLTTWAGINA